MEERKGNKRNYDLVSTTTRRRRGKREYQLICSEGTLALAFVNTAIGKGDCVLASAAKKDPFTSFPFPEEKTKNYYSKLLFFVFFLLLLAFFEHLCIIHLATCEGWDGVCIWFGVEGRSGMGQGG